MINALKCFFGWHRWTLWSEPRQIYNELGFSSSHETWTQSRRCSWCRLAQMKTVRVFE